LKTDSDPEHLMADDFKGTFCTSLLFSFLIFALVFPASSASSNDEIPGCANNLSDFPCFQRNFHNIYEEDSKLFWFLWVHHENEAKSCSSLSFTSQFISLVEKCDGVLEETMHEFIENLVLDDVSCLLGSIEKLDDDLVEHLVRFYFRTPLYHQPSEILPIIEKQLKKGRYPKLSKIYFRFLK